MEKGIGGERKKCWHIRAHLVEDEGMDAGAHRKVRKINICFYMAEHSHRKIYEYVRMCLMARLCDSCGPLRGGALASRLHSHAIHGDIQSTAVLVHRYSTSSTYTILACLPSHRHLIAVSGLWTPSARPYTP